LKGTSGHNRKDDKKYILRFFGGRGRDFNARVEYFNCQIQLIQVAIQVVPAGMAVALVFLALTGTLKGTVSDG
jgi:hypothetical protein